MYAATPKAAAGIQRIRFRLGRLVATPGAVAALTSAEVLPSQLIGRHASGDWGAMCRDDADANERALRTGARILSAYVLWTGARVWIITEADRSATTILTPGEY